MKQTLILSLLLLSGCMTTSLELGVGYKTAPNGLTGENPMGLIRFVIEDLPICNRIEVVHVSHIFDNSFREEHLEYVACVRSISLTRKD